MALFRAAKVADSRQDLPLLQEQSVLLCSTIHELLPMLRVSQKDMDLK